MVETKRKCKICKGEIILEKDKMIHVQKNEKTSYCYHYDCYLIYLTEKTRSKLTPEQAEFQAHSLLESSQKFAKDESIKNEFNKWLARKYELVFVPPCIYKKLNDIYKGDYKGLDQPISPADMMDMFQRKWNELVSINAYKRLSGADAFHYDVAVILAKSTSYFKWKLQNEIDQREIAEQAKAPRLDYEKFVPAVTENLSKASRTADYIIEDEDNDD